MAGFALLALVRGLVWSAVLPPWYGPDEITHFDYVQELALDGRVPRYAASRDDGLDVPYEVRCSGQHMGFGSENGPFLAHPELVGPRSTCPSAPADVRRPGVATSPGGGYSPVYYALAVPFWWAAAAGSVEDRDHAVRLLSVLLGTLAAVFAVLAAWEVFAARGPVVAAGLLFSLQPMSAQQFAIVNNDALLATVGAGFFWLLFGAVRRGLSLRRALLLGATAGLAYLAKPQGVFLFAGLAVPLWAVLRSRGAGAAARLAAAALAPLLVAIAAGVAVSLLTEGSVLAQATGVPVPGSHSLRDYLGVLAAQHFARPWWLFVISAWGDFGWVSAALPELFYYVAAGLTVVALTAALIARTTVSATALVAVLGVVLGTVAVEALTYRALGVLPLSGRGFLQVLVPMSVLAVAGLDALLRPVAAPAGRIAVGTFALLANLVAIGAITVAYLA